MTHSYLPWHIQLIRTPSVISTSPDASTLVASTHSSRIHIHKTWLMHAYHDSYTCDSSSFVATWGHESWLKNTYSWISRHRWLHIHIHKTWLLCSYQHLHNTWLIVVYVYTWGLTLEALPPRGGGSDLWTCIRNQHDLWMCIHNQQRREEDTTSHICIHKTWLCVSEDMSHVVWDMRHVLA